jgi:hypothetical protein
VHACMHGQSTAAGRSLCRWWLDISNHRAQCILNCARHPPKKKFLIRCSTPFGFSAAAAPAVAAAAAAASADALASTADAAASGAAASVDPGACGVGGTTGSAAGVCCVILLLFGSNGELAAVLAVRTLWLWRPGARRVGLSSMHGRCRMLAAPSICTGMQYGFSYNTLP